MDCIDTGLAYSPDKTSIGGTPGLAVVELYLHTGLFRVVIRMPGRLGISVAIPLSLDSVTALRTTSSDHSPASLSNLLSCCEAQDT